MGPDDEEEAGGTEGKEKIEEEEEEDEVEKEKDDEDGNGIIFRLDFNFFGE